MAYQLCRKGEVTLEKDESIDRDQIIFSITLKTNYSEEYLEKLSDNELLNNYERVMKQ